MRICGGCGGRGHVSLIDSVLSGCIVFSLSSSQGLGSSLDTKFRNLEKAPWLRLKAVGSGAMPSGFDS